MPRASLPIVVCLLLPADVAGFGRVARVFLRPRRASASFVRLCSDEEGASASKEEEDWRALRARLVAQERAEKTEGSRGVDDLGSSSVYECPLIEQGSVILGGTEQKFGFALRQQYFHKSVMLLLQHDKFFTKGIILNRPSALELGGWDIQQ